MSSIFPRSKEITSPLHKLIDDWRLMIDEKVDCGQAFGVDSFSKFEAVLTYKIFSTYTPTVQKEVLVGGGNQD
jgi:hypothetical protein